MASSRAQAEQLHNAEESFARDDSFDSTTPNALTGSPDQPLPPQYPPPLAGSRPPPEPKSTSPQVETFHPFSFHVLAFLAPASIFGLLARLGIQALFNYDGKSVFPLAWVQVMGCLVMGTAVGMREPLTRFYPPLYTAITTGFCGSLTTFSSWNLQVFLAWENASGYHKVWLYDILDGLTQAAFTVMLSLGSLALGLHIATHLAPRIPLNLLVQHPPSPIPRYILSIISLSAYIVTIPLFFVLPFSYRHQATAALLFCYPATLLRHFLSTTLNPRFSKRFFLGTFLANEISVVIVSVLHTLEHIPPSSGSVSRASCAILIGITDGFCGCLSTISSFAVELRGLKGKGWMYGGVSFVVAQLIMVLLMGIPWWSGAVKENAQCSL